MKMIMSVKIFKTDKTYDLLHIVTKIEVKEDILYCWKNDEIIASYNYNEVKRFDSKLYDLKRMEDVLKMVGEV